MKRGILITLAALIVIAAQPQKTFASPVAQPSATFNTNPKKAVQDSRVKVLKAYFAKYHSPLESEAEAFVAQADKYNIDYKLLPAIAGVESWFGAKIPYNSYNGWGWGIYGNKVTYFASWNQAISTISKELRERYMDKWGAENVYEIGRYYAADPKWAVKVDHFMNDIEAFEIEQTNESLPISI